MIGVNPYIAYKGNCREAIEFYKNALGAELLFSQNWGDTPHSQPGMEDKIMHATIKVGGSHVMMCDMADEYVQIGGNVSLAIGLNEVDKAREMFDNLSDGGTVTMPLDKTFWAEAFGMVTDKFGINWMVNCDAPHETDKTAAA
jgi:PhnB protein